MIKKNFKINWEDVWQEVQDNSTAFFHMKGISAPYSYERDWVEIAVNKQLKGDKNDRCKRTNL